MDDSLTLRRLGPADALALAEFFDACGRDELTQRFFHPHPLTRAFGHELAASLEHRQDRYFGAFYRDVIVGYSMLRGWDDGFAVPSFGCCVHPELRNAGIGQVLMIHAIRESQAAGAPRLRLTVYKANERAVHVYAKYGFTYQAKNELEWVGVLDLGQVPPLPSAAPKLDALANWYAGRQHAAVTSAPLSRSCHRQAG